jgi:hypothetical protein
MKIHRAEIVGTFITVTGSTTNLTGSFKGTFEGDEKLATTGSNTFNGNQTVNGDMTVTGRIVAEEFYTELISSSIIYKSGSTKFGDSLDDNHGFTGSLSISGSLNINGTSYSAATSGTSGASGSSGATGSSGSGGTSGTDGTAGSGGTSGANGTNGTSGADGSSGATGSSGSGGTSGSSGISVGNAYLHTQSSSSSTWTITHNLNYKYLSVTVYDSSDNVMLPESIVANSENQLTISFGVSESGYAMLSYGASSSGTSGASGATGTSGSSGSSGSSGTSAGSASRNVTTFIATSGQTTFTISSGYTVGLVDVFVNGVRYSPTDFTATNGTTVVLGVSSDVDDVVDIIHYVSSMTAIAGEGTTGTISKYTASGTIGNSIITDNGTNATVNGSLTVTGNLTAQQFIVSSSVTHLTTSFSSGSTKFGDSSDDNHNFTGSLIVSGSANPLRVGSNLLFVSSSGFIGINNVSPTVALDVTGAGKFSGALTGTSATFSINQNADTIVSVSNTTAGTTSQAYFQATSDTTAGYTSFGKASSSFTAYKILTASSGYIYNSKGDISILNDASTGTIKMAAGGSSTAHFTIASTGAATFSSTVTAKGFLYLGEASVENGVINSPEGIYINADSDASGGANDIVFGKGRTSTSGGTTLMTIKNAGNVGIGTTSPNDLLELKSTSANNPNLRLYSTFNAGASAYGINWYRDYDSVSNTIAAFIRYNRSGGFDGDMIFGTGNAGASERMRITSGGDVCVGTTTAGFTAVGRGNITIGGPSTSILSLKPGSADGGYMYHASTSLSINNNSSGGIYMTALSAGVVLSNGATAWASSSDERLKNINSNIENALDKLLSLRAVNFNWKSDDTKKEVLGLIAQDVDKVFPQVVDKSKLPFDINGERTDETEYLNIRYTELVPVLVRAIQELSAELTSAKQEIELLKLK